LLIKSEGKAASIHSEGVRESVHTAARFNFDTRWGEWSASLPDRFNPL